MECKYDHSLKFRTALHHELIDTLWNVNNREEEIKNDKSDELIDTLWNVNVERKATVSNKRSELIDTLWNVNMLLQPRTMLAGRINRYIMECKLIFNFFYIDECINHRIKLDSRSL